MSSETNVEKNDLIEQIPGAAVVEQSALPGVDLLAIFRKELVIGESGDQSRVH